jgi:Clostripain family.
MMTMMISFNNQYKRLVVWMFFAVISFSGISVCHGENKRDFTLLIYMNGSNLESKNKLATEDIKEMLQSIEGNDNFTALLLMGGTKNWHLDGLSQEIATDSITYAQIDHRGFRKIASVESKSIGDASTLSEFVEFSMKKFPSERYGLIFWNHGAGSVSGFGYDELYPDDTSLLLHEIQSGLQNSLPEGQKFAFVGFDACLMATLETATVVAPFADYMVASQELEPGGGWNYTPIFSLLSQNPKTESSEICKNIVSSFVDYYSYSDNPNEKLWKNKNEFERVTLSVVDLSVIDTLVDNIGELSRIKKEELISKNDTINGIIVDEKSYMKIADSRAKTESFGVPSLTYYGPDMIDVWDFCQKISEPKDSLLINKIYENIHKAVVYSGKSVNLSRNETCGLSIYFPYYNMNVAKNLTEYYRSGFNDEYLNLVEIFSQELLSGIQGAKSKTVFANDSVNLLSADMILNTRKIYAVVLEEKEDGKMISYGMDGDGIRLDEYGRIVHMIDETNSTVRWDKNWISIGGKIVSVYQTLSGKEALSYTVPALLNGELVDLILTYNETYSSGKVSVARRVVNELIPDKGFVKINQGDSITILHEVFNEDDSVPVEYIPSETLVILKNKDIKVDITSMPVGKYRYGYCLVDLYGRKHYTKFVEYSVK